MPDLEGKYGLITGAAGGIGRATAVACARHGARVLVSDLPSKRADLDHTAALVAEAGHEAIVHTGDVALAATAESMVGETVAAFGRLDFAHNNAGIGHFALLAETDEVDFDRVLATNLKGVWLGMTYQLRAMLDQSGGGAIVNTSSLAGLVAGAPAIGAYVASKHGVAGLTKTAAIEYAEAGIRVNAVCPAAIRTPLMDTLPPGEIDNLLAMQAIKRVGEPDEVASVVVFLCSDRASFVTGHCMPVDAGALAL